MSRMFSTAEGLATSTGVAILFATTNANVLSTGGWFTSHAMLVAALSAGVFAGARVVGLGAGKIGLVIVAALLAGEAYNFSATAERIVVERENGAAPLKDALVKHTAAIDKLRQAEAALVTSARLEQAKADKQAKDEAVTKEASDGCKSECRRKQALADKAQDEVVAAAAEAEQMHQAAIDEAKAEVEATPLPASATPLADRLGLPAWALDLIMAGLLSVGANGLAGTLIAFGAQSESGKSEKTEVETVPTIPTSVPGTPPKGRGGRKADPKVVNFTDAFARAHGRAPSGSEIKAYFPELPTSTAYDYAKRSTG